MEYHAAMKRDEPLLYIMTQMNLKNITLGFPDGAVVKNPPASARDIGSSPGPGRSHMPQSPRDTTIEACARRARAPQQEKPPQ